MINSRSHTLNVYKQSIISLDTSSVKLISELVAEEAGTNDYFEHWDIMIFGYANDPRGLYDIPEVRRWCQQAVSEFPFLPSVLTTAVFARIRIGRLRKPMDIGRKFKTDFSFERKPL